MGINVSRNVDLTENEYLQKFVGKDHIPIHDTEFWNSLLQYHISVPSNSQEQLSLDSRLESLCQSFISHNLLTGNFGSLISIFLDKVNELLSLSDQESTMHIWQTLNALFIIRSLIKYIIETGNEFQLIRHFEATPDLEQITKHQQNTTSSNDSNINIKNDATTINIEDKNPTDTVITGTAITEKNLGTGNNNRIPITTTISNTDDEIKFEAFFEAIVNIVVIIPVKEFTYHLHLESVNTIITLLSVHLFSERPPDKSVIFKTIYKCPIANVLTSALLHFVSRMVQAPPTMFGIPSGGSFVFGIAESLLSIFTFRKPQDILSASAIGTSNVTANELNEQFKIHYPLANQSLLLILILTNHCTTKDNPYRISLFGCSDSKESPKEGSTFKIDFQALYNTLCRIVTIDQATLLLYLLLHRNQKFYKFVMSQTNLQQLVIPILQTLYHAPDSTSHHIYMSLIVLLILSEDDGFNKNVHQIILKNVTWYTERSISEISLGGLLILVVIRTIQYNMSKMRDKYLHTNCLAALANMSGQFRSLHPYVAQRLVSLFETLAKKHSRLQAQLKQQTPEQQQQQILNNGSIAVNIPSSSSSSSASLQQQSTQITLSPEDMLQDLNVLEEVLRMVLEILNSCLSNQLVYCPNLVYTLLYKREVFEGFRSNPAFQDIIQNIDMVVGFFSSRLQRVQDQRGELGVNEVLEVISKGASQWSSDRLRKFPDLKFKYVEEDAPEEFFIPYVWTLVTKYGCIHFSSESIKGVITDVAC